MKPSYILTSDFVTVVYNGKPQTVGKDDIRYPKILEIIRSGTWHNLSKVLETKELIKNLCCGRVEVIGETVTFGGKVINNCLTKRIVEFVREDIPFEPLVKFMDKLMDNPSYRSREQIYQFMEANKMPITDDGDVIFFKVVTKDFKDCHTKTIDNSIGQIVKMDRSMVDDDPNSACSQGLHCASWSYCQTFGGSDSKVILVRVNPVNIVSVPADHNASKVRVCEYEVVKVVGDRNDVVDFDSNYAPENAENKDSDIIGGDRAYKLHKDGKTLKNGEIVVNPIDCKTRKFFRDNALSGWIIV